MTLRVTLKCRWRSVFKAFPGKSIYGGAWKEKALVDTWDGCENIIINTVRRSASQSSKES